MQSNKAKMKITTHIQQDTNILFDKEKEIVSFFIYKEKQIINCTLKFKRKIIIKIK